MVYDYQDELHCIQTFYFRNIKGPLWDMMLLFRNRSRCSSLSAASPPQSCCSMLASLSPQNVSGKQGNLLPRQPFKRFSWWVMLHFSVSNRVCVVTAARCRCWSSGHKKLNNSCKCNWITHTHTHTNCTCGEGIVRAVSLKPAFYITECSTFNLSAKTTLLFKGSQEIKVNARNHEEKLKK